MQQQRLAANQEAQAAAQQYYETLALLQGDAARAAEAENRELLDTLQNRTAEEQQRVTALKEKVMLFSAENVSKQELIESMEVRLAELSAELTRVTVLQSKSVGTGRQTEDNRTLELQTLFEACMERAVRLKQAATAAYIPENLKAKALISGVRSTPVYYSPNGETRANALSTMEVRLGRSTTFREITVTAARFFGEDEHASVLEDENGSVWPIDVMAARELARYRGDQTLRLVYREEVMVENGRAEAAEEEGEEGAEAPVAGLLTMLGNGKAPQASGSGGGGGGGGGGEDGGEDAEADNAAAVAAVAALAAMEESDSDDDDLQKKVYIEPEINRKKEYIDMVLHLIFLILLYLSVTAKRQLKNAFAMTEALQTVFIDEEFGDYNEKNFLDVRNFEEAFDWTSGTLVDGLFESDVDDTGNIMMYNQLVGAVRLRQLRVTNTSCPLSSRIQRPVEVEGVTFTQSFFFPAPNFGDGGGCFGDYSTARRDEGSYGPCTKDGRQALGDVPGLTDDTLNQYNTSCFNSGFEWWPFSQTNAPRSVVFNDGSGYVRDIEPNEPLPNADIPKLPKGRFEDVIQELRDFLWLDERTRAMVISFSVYNANFNLYAACNFVFQLNPGGTVMPEYRFKVMKLDLYENVEGFSDLLNNPAAILDFLVIGLLLRIMFKEIYRYIYIRWTYGTSIPYIRNIWNLLEIANIVPFFFAWGTRVAFVFDPLGATYKKGMFAVRYAELAQQADNYSLAFAYDSISLLVSFLKFFKYFRLFDQTALLWNVLSGAGKDMGFFIFVLLLFLIAFTIFAEQMFGPTLVDFSAPLESFTTLLNQVFGVVDIYWEMNRTAQQPLLAIIFFIIYTIIIFFVLVNVFLAILNDAYGAARGDMDERIAQKRLAKEEYAKEHPKAALSERVAKLRKVARGRFSRFQARVVGAARRRRAKPVTVDDAIASLYYENQN